MIKTVSVNPFVEAMLYYSERANNDKIENRLKELMAQFPESSAEIEKAAQPALSLKKRLDAGLDADDALICKFFKKIGNRRPSLPFKFCLAFIMIGLPVMINIDFSPDEICRFIRKGSEESRMYFIRWALSDSGENIERSKYSFKDISKCIENMQIPFEGKWEIINAVINYREQTEALLSLIIPAAKLIGEARNEYKAIEDEFDNRYAGEDAEALLHSFWGVNITPIEIIKAAPALFSFYSKYVSLEFPQLNDEIANGSVKYRYAYGGMIIGTARHLINATDEGRISILSRKMQVLSDFTRLKILLYLCKNKAYGQELCAKFTLVPSALSYHISKLSAAGFVATELSGGKTFYTADKENIDRMIDELTQKTR